MSVPKLWLFLQKPAEIRRSHVAPKCPPALRFASLDCQGLPNLCSHNPKVAGSNPAPATTFQVQQWRGVSARLPRVQRVGKIPSKSRFCDRIVSVFSGTGLQRARGPLAALALLTFPAPARASLLGSVALHAGLQGADYCSTRYALAHGGTEGNAFMRSDAEAKKLLATFVLGGVDDELGKRSKRLQWGFRAGVFVWVARTVGHNILGARR
jgi:hypothetical protein